MCSRGHDADADADADKDRDGNRVADCHDGDARGVSVMADPRLNPRLNAEPMHPR